MSNDEYQHQEFWKTPFNTDVCIEQDKEGQCLMSARWMIIDMSEPPKEKEDAYKNV